MRPPSCTVLPLLHATIPLPTSLADTLPVGATTFDFTVARIAGAAPAAVTAATLSTSTDGTTFHPAKVVALGQGVFQATIVNGAVLRRARRLATGHRVRRRGSTISQTVTAAYQVAAN